MTEPYPLVFEPILKEKVWGGRRLARYGKTLGGDARYGESWEIADLASTSASGGGGGSAVSVIRNGPMAGRTIADALAAWGVSLLGEGGMRRARAVGERTGAGRPVFPLLVKYLDAGEHLSVQVHPSPEYARTHDDAHLKTESWYVIESERTALPSGAEIQPSVFVGLAGGVDSDAFRAHIADGTVAADLRCLPATPGDCHTLPSGTVHALGGGVLVAEVQTPSDTTFRVYDWAREYDRPERELHIDQAVECIDFTDASEAPCTRGEHRAAATEFYSIDSVRGGCGFQGGRVVVLMVLAGTGELAGAGDPLPVSAGTTVLVPAVCAGDVSLTGDESLHTLVIGLGEA